MMNRYASALVWSGMALLSANDILAQCAPITANGPNPNATTCICATSGQTDCDLLPDIMINWYGLANTSSGPSEYSQIASGNAGRLRVSGVTPNVGFGPLEVRGVRADGYRKFICGSLIDSIYAPSTNPGFTCPNGFNPKQILFQRIYHKNGSTMSFNELERGTMTYHPSHNHYHVNGWTTMTLRLAQPGVTDPRQWPVLATGGKLGFCLTNLFTCGGSPNYCKDSPWYNQGSNIPTSYWGANYGLGPSPGCSDDVQTIVVGKGDIYDESLDGMWVNMLPGLCNGQYYIVAEADPANDFIESDETNNWTYVPVTLAQQSPANNGGTANILCNGSTVIAPGQTRTLTASPGTAYAWSTGSTARSITVSAAGTYSCTVNCPCGSLSTPSLTITSLPAPPTPVGTNGQHFGTGTVDLSATGSDLHWFDAPTNGNEVGTGNNFTTPVLISTANYWVEARTTQAGENAQGGRVNNTTQGAYSDTKQWLLFDALKPFKLESFTVRANSTGQRHFVLVDRLGNLIAEKYIEIPAGLNTITVNWDVPVGVQHKISAFDDNTETFRNLWYNNAGATYPYQVGTVATITGATDGTTNYWYLYDWVVSTPSVTAVSARTQVTATITQPLALTLKAMLEGPFDPNTGLMRDDLRTGGLIPATEPYTGMGFPQVAGGGAEVLQPSLLSVTGNNAPVDWVRVELRSAADPAVVLATRQGILQRDGDVTASDGGPSLLFDLVAGNYHVVVRHRNHLGCMTASALALSPSPLLVDLSSVATGTWGSSARKQSGSAMLLWAGNALMNNALKYSGSGNDRDPILTVVGSTTPTNTVAGYQGVDVNLDGVIKYTGASNDRDPILVNVGSTTPNNVRSEQLP